MGMDVVDGGSLLEVTAKVSLVASWLVLAVENYCVESLRAGVFVFGPRVIRRRVDLRRPPSSSIVGAVCSAGPMIFKLLTPEELILAPDFRIQPRRSMFIVKARVTWRSESAELEGRMVVGPIALLFNVGVVGILWFGVVMSVPTAPRLVGALVGILALVALAVVIWVRNPRAELERVDAAVAELRRRFDSD